MYMHAIMYHPALASQPIPQTEPLQLGTCYGSHSSALNTPALARRAGEARQSHGQSCGGCGRGLRQTRVTHERTRTPGRFVSTCSLTDARKEGSACTFAHGGPQGLTEIELSQPISLHLMVVGEVLGLLRGDRPQVTWAERVQNRDIDSAWCKKSDPRARRSRMISADRKWLNCDRDRVGKERVQKTREPRGVPGNLIGPRGVSARPRVSPVAADRRNGRRGVNQRAGGQECIRLGRLCAGLGCVPVRGVRGVLVESLGVCSALI